LNLYIKILIAVFVFIVSTIGTIYGQVNNIEKLAIISFLIALIDTSVIIIFIVNEYDSYTM
jgi:signal transduction histidine kinase